MLKVEINSDLSNNTVHAAKNITQLSAGDRFKAEITDIKRDSITLRLLSNAANNIIEAKSLIVPNARIGQTAEFVVRENNNGRIFLEFASRNTAVSEGTLKEILTDFKLEANSQNTGLINLLMKNNIPLNEDTIGKALFFKQEAPDIKDNELIFLVKENFPASTESISLLNSILDKTASLKGSIALLADEIINNTEGQLKERLLKLLNVSDAPNKSAVIKQLIKGLSVELDKSDSLKNTPERFAEIQETLEKIKAEVQDTKQNANHEGIAKAMQGAENSLEFMREVDNTKQYLQLPLFVNEKQAECELYIFKDRKKGKASSSADVLIALDYPFIGHTEAYINKADKTLNIQLRLETETALELAEKNKSRLAAMLQSKGYKIIGLSVKKSNERFDVTKEAGVQNTAQESKRRYSFDMRV